MNNRELLVNDTTFSHWMTNKITFEERSGTELVSIILF